MATAVDEATFSEQFKLLAHGTIYVDPDGDLDLIVGLGDCSRTFCVSSKSMRLASPVWRAMLRSDYGFKEANDTTKTITFPEDDVVAFFIVLLAIHLRYQEIPKSLDHKELLNLCIFCDKYDTLNKSGTPEDWIVIAGTIGDEGLLKEAKNGLVQTCKTDDAGRCLTGTLKPLDDRVPYGLAEDIVRIRLAILTQLIQACHLMVNKYISSNNKRVCKGIWGQGDCDMFMLGHLVVQLQKIQLWPGDPKELAKCMNTKNLLEVLVDIKAFHDYMKPEGGKPKCLAADRSSAHVGCGCTNALVKTATQLILGDKEFKDLELEKKHLQSQRLKLEPSKIDESKFQRRGTLRGV